MSGSGKFAIGQEPFRLGVSYWPLRAEHDLWRNFDIDEVQQDFSLMSEQGINLARIVLPREDFQAEPDSLRCSALAHLLELCDAAASEGIKLELLLFADRAGNPAYQPDWLQTDPGPEQAAPQAVASNHRDADRDPPQLRAARAMAKGVARAVGAHSAVWAFNLGVLARSVAPHESRELTRLWHDSLSQAIRGVGDRPLLTCSFGGASLSDAEVPRLDQLCAGLDHGTLHCHCSESACAVTDKAAFSCALARALTGRPCLLDEKTLGREGSTAVSPFEMLALLHALHRVGALGIVIGAFADLFVSEVSPPRNEELTNYGLPRRMSPHAEALLTFAHERPLVPKKPLDVLDLGVSIEEYYERPAFHADRLYEQFLATWSGTRP